MFYAAAYNVHGNYCQLRLRIEGQVYTDIYKEYKDVTGIVEFSKIGYNADRTKALVEICLYRTPKTHLDFIWLKFENDKWIVTGEKNDLIS